jgi:cobalt-precorrin-5B (C1)-methyltransferase
MAGLGLAVGGPAINPVPRLNNEENVREVGSALLASDGLQVTISVPQGLEMAKKTLNARLGILGGISILGTTGIVKPYSTAAYRASVVQGVEVAATTGSDTVVLTTGGRTEKFAIAEMPGLPEACFVQMGDFLRYALDAAVKAKLKRIVIGGMVGKLTKIAQGETITHANRAEVDTDLLARLAASIGAARRMRSDRRRRDRALRGRAHAGAGADRPVPPRAGAPGGQHRDGPLPGPLPARRAGVRFRRQEGCGGLFE